ncbi:MAG: hypothetical protein HQL72_02360 [Magnetococcales bacterium]|nr:hypothetical protein [Magnetococcales bacterium]
MNTVQTQPEPLSWGEIQLNQVLWVNFVPHATRQAIGEWLEYAEPRISISTLLERNPYIEEYATVINLITVDGKKRDVSVYHPIGFLLICMESQTEKAKEMKQQIAAFVWDFCQPEELTFKEKIELTKLRRTILVDLAKIKDSFVRRGLLDDLARVSKMLREPLPDLALLGSEGEQLVLDGLGV